MKIERYFTEEGKKAEDYFKFVREDVDITDDNGQLQFVQKNAEFPENYSKLAKKITASKYFFGEHGTSQRENSIKDLIGRVSDTMSEWGIKQKYFSDEEAKIFREELAYLVYDQKMAFNSPVWFNVGIHKRVEGNPEKKEGYIIDEKGDSVPLPIGKDREYPQTSACFIQSLEDTMEGIMDLAKKEALLFKYGSGTGTNLSTLRSSREKLSGGGRPSGPLAYWAFYDKVAGIVKSGGKTRRAAKMDILNVEHPNILEFIDSKKIEEERLHILIDNGIPWREAQESVNYQNTNISARASDKFMNSVNEDKDWQTIPVHNKEMIDKMPKYKARDLLRHIAEATHFCGDPGMQFHDTINKWHTCKNSGQINASNPCSEYMFLDDSACNLASLNLLKFMKDGEFDVDSFKQAVRITAIAMDLNIDNSSYPTKEIAKNSHKFRPLGMGYANLGSLVMSQGLAYDSEEARAMASSITALMTGTAYEVSSEMTKQIGSFKEFKKNKAPMLDVMKMHRKELDNINSKKLPKGLEQTLGEARLTWDRVVEKGQEYGFRNAQAVVLAPTGTIGFMMDCDTKGMEPEIGLVQTKILSDGGILRLVNSTVDPALEKLGYNKEQIKDIKEYIAGKGFVNVPHLKQEDLEEIKKKPFELREILKEKKGYSEKEIEEINFYINGYETMEGAPHIKEEHLAVFDCSNKPKHGKRTISPEGHLKMMAAIQPYISGAISKTVNLPEEATVGEIENIYMNAWKMGLKAVALYRDNSKRVQPLNFSKGRSLEKEVFKPMRRKLPNTRNGLIHKFNIAEHEGYITIGMYDDGSPGELFITMSKEGSTIGGLMDTVGTLTSLALQYGVPLKNLANKFKNQKFEPYGIVLEGHSDIKAADSVIDYIFRFLEKTFPNGNHEINSTEKEQKQIIIQQEENNTPTEELGGFCGNCGKRMIKKGHCLEVCICGWQSPKGCGE